MGLLDGVDLGLFLLPAFCQALDFVLGRLEVGLKLLPALLARDVLFFAQALELDLDGHDLLVEAQDVFGFALLLQSQRARGLVHQVDGLVGEEAVGDVAVRVGSGSHQGAVGDAHAVVDLILVLDAAEDADGVWYGRFADEDGLEASGQGDVFFDLAVLGEGRGAAALELAPGQGRLQQV